VAPQRVLVTGGSGFVAQQLIGRLRREDGVEVLALSRTPTSVGDVTVDPVDLADERALQEWSAARTSRHGLDGIFHLAAQVPARFDGAEAEQSREANLRMTAHVLALAQRHRCPLVYASSTSVYGGNPPSPCTEQVPPAPGNGYAEGKLAGEALMTRAHDETGLITSSLRISAPYGPTQRLRTVISIFVDAAIAGQVLTVQGSGERTQDFTFVTDVAEAFWRAFQHEAVGVYNVSGNSPVSMRSLAELVIECVGGDPSRIRVGTASDAQDGYRGVFPTDKAHSAFGFTARVTLREGLRRMIDARTASLPNAIREA
jgi:UDP-glucose 4-epimerase